MATFTFLGTASGCGMPAFFCDCPACQEARENPRARRGCCGAVIEGASQRMLLDTPPDLRHQFNREGIASVDRLIYTHAHFDHLGGLGELEYFIRLQRGDALPVWGSAEALAGVQAEFHYMTDILDMRVLDPYETFEFDGVTYTALPVAHAPGTFGYLIDSGDARLFYASDTGPLPAQTAEMVKGCDILILDATFWERNWSPENHHSVQETIDEGIALDAGHIYLTHLAMHYSEPITLAELEEYLLPYEGRIQVAADGLALTF